MLIMGTLFDMVEPVLIIAAALSVQSPFTRRIGDEFQVDVDHRRSELQSEHGDPFTLLNVYDEWLRLKTDKHSNSRKWCRKRAIEEERLYEISKLKRQFEDLLSDHKLIEKQKLLHRSKAEKERYAGNKRRLIDLKREYHKQSRRRKILKVDGPKVDESEEEEEGKIDIQAIQFELTHDLDKLQKSTGNRKFSFLETNVLKIIVCSGLFPQIAVPDESNPWRRSSDMTFHSREKQFLCLHPTSVYSARPELLCQDNTENKQKIEGQHGGNKELLAYVSLLETNKPFLMNSMRVPVLQTILLFSSGLDTNSDCTRVICDGWIELSFKDSSKAQQLLSDVIKLRNAWYHLLELRLRTVEFHRENHESLDHISSIQRRLTRKLAEFIASNVQYSFRRISSTETAYLYVTSLPNKSNDAEDDKSTDEALAETASADAGSADAASKWLPLDDGVPHPTKGGLRVTDYMTYGCVRDDLSVAVAKGQAEYLREHYHCQICGEHLICNILERLQHDSGCQSSQPPEEKSKSERIHSEAKEEQSTATVTGESRMDMEQTENMPLATNYYCLVCEENFRFTPVEILKHKRSHR